MAHERQDWKQQLSKVSGVVQKNQKLAELRNEKEITRAVCYVEEELAAHLDLSTSDAAGSPSKSLVLKGLITIIKNIGYGQTSRELAKSVDELLDVIERLDQAAKDLVAGAEAQAAELFSELEKIEDRKSSLPSVSLLEIENELSRRQEMRDRVLLIQEGLENERDEITERTRILKEIISRGASRNTSTDKIEKQKLERKIEALELTISSVVEAVAQNDREVELLIAYQNAVKLTREGLPSNIIGKKLEFGS